MAVALGLCGVLVLASQTQAQPSTQVRLSLDTRSIVEVVPTVVYAYKRYDMAAAGSTTAAVSGPIVLSWEPTPGQVFETDRVQGQATATAQDMGRLQARLEGQFMTVNANGISGEAKAAFDDVLRVQTGSSAPLLELVADVQLDWTARRPPQLAPVTHVEPFGEVWLGPVLRTAVGFDLFVGGSASAAYGQAWQGGWSGLTQQVIDPPDPSGRFQAAVVLGRFAPGQALATRLQLTSWLAGEEYCLGACVYRSDVVLSIVGWAVRDAATGQAVAIQSLVGASGTNYLASAVPEPAAAALWLAGLGVLVGARRRCRSAAG